MKTAVLQITAVLAMATLAMAAENDQTDDSLLTLDKIFVAGEFNSKHFGSAKWLDDGPSYTVLEASQQHKGGRDIVRYNAKKGKRTILVPDGRLIPVGQSTPLGISGYSWSADRKKLLIFTNTRRVWRRHTRGDYWVLDLESEKLQKLGGDAEEATLMFAKFSPDGRRVGYVCKKNIYIQDLKDLKVTPLTESGSQTIINGTSDWVNEEELDLRDGFRFSPDGRHVAYWQFDTSGVRRFHLINNTDASYPKITTFAYPKVGETNSICRVGVIGVAGGETRWFEPSDDLRNHYLPRMRWAADSREIILQQLNRLQNTMHIMLGNIGTGEIRTILTDRDEAWVDTRRGPQWLDDGKRFLLLSERDGWQHLYLCSHGGDEPLLLTPGSFDVIGIAKIDEQRGWVYYIASPDNPTQRYLYRSKLDGRGKSQRVTPADRPGTHSYQISPDARWALHTYSNINTPPVTQLIRLPRHKTVRVLEDNSELRAKIARLKRSPTELFRVDIGNGVLLDGWCMKPPGMQPDKQYPLFYYVYGEPAGSTVRDAWGGQNAMWHTMLAQRGYIVASIDNRGTHVPRGRAWRKSIYRQVGILASSDQAAATRALIRQWPYVDPKRIGTWGASGGGSMSLNAIFRHPELYSTAMAISFISNQRFYDTIYQERYMGLPDDNQEGYKNGSPITHAHRLQGNLLLVHGTGDDNCHYQNCEALVNELVKHNKQFSLMSYPNRTHSLGGGNTRRHLYGLLTRYLEENMPPGPRVSRKR